jgi:two-component system chemotaxis sensor kinase CheA
MTAQPQGSLAFREELRELLAELDSTILDLDGAPDNVETVNRVFRALHTIKGGCDMFGLAMAVALLHDMESLWDRVRMGVLKPGKDLLDVTLAMKDLLEPTAETGFDVEPGQALLSAMAALTEPPPAAKAAPADAPPGDFAQAPAGTTRRFSVTLAPTDPGHLRKLDPAALIAELRELGQAVVTALPDGVPMLEDLDPADCHLRFEVALTTDRDADAVRDVFLFLENPGDAVVAELSPEQARLSLEVPRAAPALSPASSAPAASGWAAPGPRRSAPEKPRVESPAAAPPTPAAQAAAKPKEPAQSLRVEAAKLDNLVNLVGELVIAQARLTQIASAAANPGLTGVSEEIERLVSELRDNTLSIRMLPIGTTFSRFRRLVRDLSSELGKEIELVAEGGETELDKTVIEQLGDPLVHLLRNSIDHGVEPPAERRQAGKAECGTIHLSAKQAGGAVIIRIADDGRGLNTSRIRAKAAERGIIAPDAKLSDQEIFHLIFAPGFSTAEKVTSVSGRGVGMDVVKRSIDALRGSLDIDSVGGKGTAITIALPLTLAIIDGLQVRAAGEFYIIPLSMVEECVELAGDGGGESGRKRTLSIRGEIIPYVRLRETFALPGRPPELEQVVVTRMENGLTGIAVDEVVGQQQTVIKGLGKLIGRVEGISGATINGDGSMALILDVQGLVAGVQRQTDEAWAQ